MKKPIILFLILLIVSGCSTLYGDNDDFESFTMREWKGYECNVDNQSCEYMRIKSDAPGNRNPFEFTTLEDCELHCI
jgi:hypothetical protein